MANKETIRYSMTTPKYMLMGTKASLNAQYIMTSITE
jgi:hypothetical protein